MANTVFFDIEALEKQAREMIERQHKEGDAAVARGEADAGFVLAQKQFTEARVEFFLAGMRAQNLGVDKYDVLLAAGACLGMMHGSLMSSIGPHADIAKEVNDWTLKASMAVQNLQQDDGTPIEVISVSPMKGGTA